MDVHANECRIFKKSEKDVRQFCIDDQSQFIPDQLSKWLFAVQKLRCLNLLEAIHTFRDRFLMYQS